MATNLNIDDVTYELWKDTVTDEAIKTNKKYYIRASKPLCYLTDNMTKREANKVAKSMRQLGFTVIDMVKKK